MNFYQYRDILQKDMKVIDMSKIIVLQCFSDSGFSTDYIFEGNEFSRDPADMIQLISEQFTCTESNGHLHVLHDTINWSPKVSEDVIHVLRKNGYVLLNPKRVIV
ncbi:hypothetical protein 7t3_0613 [Salmonella phage 7t3]|nr:hypothetical protein 7t3_0613 [Salmonella phage 7t3]